MNNLRSNRFNPVSIKWSKISFYIFKLFTSTTGYSGKIIKMHFLPRKKFYFHLSDSVESIVPCDEGVQ